MKKYCIVSIVVLLLFGSHQSLAQQNNGQLLIDVAETCVTGNHEPSDCQLLRRGADVFNLPQLSKLASMLEEKTLDIGYQNTISAIQPLLEYAEKNYGQASLEAITARRALADIYSFINWQTSVTLMKENEQYAIAYSKTSSQKEHASQLKRVIQIELLLMQKQHDPDNPEHLKQLLDIEKNIAPYLKKDIATPELVDLLMCVANLKNYQTRYVDYLIFLNSQDLPLALDYAQKAYDMSRRLWHKNDLRCLRAEMMLLALKIRNNQDDYATIHKRLEEMQSYVTDYLPTGSIMPIDVELLKWDCNIVFGQQLYEIRPPYPLLYKIENFYGSDSEEYFLYLNRLFAQEAQVDLQRAASMVNDVEKKAIDLFLSDNDLYALTMVDEFLVMHALAQQKPDVYRNYMENLTGFYTSYHRPTWASIYTGRVLVDIYSSSLSLIDKAIEINQIVLDDTRKLAGENCFIYLCCLNDFAMLQSAASQPETLLSAEKNLKEIIRLSKTFNVNNVYAYLQLSEVQSALKQDAESIETLKEAISVCKSKENHIWRSILQMALGWQLTNYGAKGLSPESKQLFNEAIPYFIENRTQANGIQLRGYLYAEYYYRLNNQLDKAEETLLMGIEHHEQTINDYDEIYTSMIIDLYELYVNNLNDMDKADKLITLCLDNIKNAPSFALHNVVWRLLWERYNYVCTNYSKDFVMRWSVLNELIKEMNLMTSLTGSDSEQLRDMFMPLLYEVMNICSIMGELERDTDYQNVPDNEEAKNYILATQKSASQFKVLVKEQILPILIEKEKMLSQQDSSYIDFAETQQLYYALANYYLGVERDTLKGTSYYERLCQSTVPSTRCYAAYQLAIIRYRQGQFSQAANLLDDIKELSDQEAFIMNGKAEKANYNQLRNLANYYCGRYEQALDAAREMFSMRQQLITQNFDFLTEAERNDFIDRGCAGGDGLLALLPHFGNTLAPEGYDAALAEKGVLLRASERIKKAIIGSGDPVLLAQLDSLAILESAYKQMNANSPNEQGLFIIGSDVIETRQAIERLEREINRNAAKYLKGHGTTDWKHLQSVLKPGEAAIEYVFCDTILGALVLLPKDKPHYVSLPSSTELATELGSVSQLPLQQSIEQIYSEDKLHLYEKLWKPLEPLLKGAKNIYFSPTGFLNSLAFAAMKCDKDTYLSERYMLHQMLSTGNLLDIRQHSQQGKISSCALFGGVFYSPDQQYQRNVTNNHRGAIEEAFNYLPYTELELQAVGKLLDSHHISYKVKTGFESTEQAFRELGGNSPDVLHLSTHGFFLSSEQEVMDNAFLKQFPNTRFQSMQRSGLAMAGASATWEGEASLPEEADGIITANEVSRLDLSHTRLAVLSACQTATGHYSKEGVFGMHRGFKQAGVKSILATLWNVNDKSTARLMELFYQKWLSGTPMQQSFHDAVRELRQEYPSPFYWAPFVLMDAE